MGETVSSPKVRDAYVDALPVARALYERTRTLFPDA